MANKRYLPFALREVKMCQGATPDAGYPTRKQAVQISSLDIGTDKDVLLQDLSVRLITTGRDNPIPCTDVLMRVGWLGKGYLLKRPLPVGTFHNKARPGCGSWRFIEPYFLDAKKHLRVLYTPRGTDSRYRGIVFNCTRADNGKQYYLYAGSEEPVSVANGAVPFVREHLGAPPDTGLWVHSVSISDYFLDVDEDGFADDGPQLQIVSPGGYEWFKFSPSNLAGAYNLAHMKYRWLDPGVSMMELGPERGWVIHPRQTFIVEIDMIRELNILAVVTLRGCVEV